MSFTVILQKCRQVAGDRRVGLEGQPDLEEAGGPAAGRTVGEVAAREEAVEERLEHPRDVAALAGVLVLGPRLGKYLPGGKMKPILGHNMPLATIGVFLLFLGWFGFNGGSVLNANPGLVSLVFVTTALAAAAAVGPAGAVVGVDPLRSPQRWEAAPRPGAGALLLVATLALCSALLAQLGAEHVQRQVAHGA